MDNLTGKAMRVAQIGCGDLRRPPESVRGIPLDGAGRRGGRRRGSPRGRRPRAHGGVPWTTRFEDVLERPDVDIVSIATPHHLHAPQTIAAASAGKHVLCEKPLTTTLPAAQEMIDVCRGAGVKLGMWFVARYTAPFRTARTLLRAGAIGER